MDMSDKDKLELEKRSDHNPRNCHLSSNMPIDWRSSGGNISNSNPGLIPSENQMPICNRDLIGASSCSYASMIEPIGPGLWDHPNNPQNLGVCNISVQNHATTLNPLKGGPSTMDIGWNPPSSMAKGGIFLPGIFPQNQIPADSAFIERAARFSCFNGGNFSDMANPFGLPEPIGILSPLKNDQKGDSLVKSLDEEKQGVGGSGNESEEAELSGNGGQDGLNGGELDSKSLGSKKRKRNGKKTELNRPKGNEKSAETAKDSPEVQQKAVEKEEYIHVRARRGQATNSHSLAERVRREKISERMKFLQDLVPGCSKVTGKAVMLDEIINYVQSLQRQVEFLSMKLATVNPRIDFNMESLLAKDILHSRIMPSSSMVFSPDMPVTYPPFNTSQPGLIQPSFPGMDGNSDVLRRTIASHIPNTWDDELHNVVQMGYGTSGQQEGQDTSSSR